MAALLGYRNENSYGHIITIEDPIEFVHEHKNCIITQREVGVDTDGWQIALKNTLRQAPDVILIGEVRDRETMDYAIAFAETGHLCLATLHANSTNQALDRIINFFPEERRAQLLMDLSLNMRAFVAQRLIPRRDGRGRVPAVEVMLNSPLISDLIFKGDVSGIKEIMKKSRELGMQTFDQSLFDLYEAGLISYEDALRNADSLNDLRLEIKLHGKEAKNRNIFAGIGNLDIVPERRRSTDLSRRDAARHRAGSRVQLRLCATAAPDCQRYDSAAWPASTHDPASPPRSSCTRRSRVLEIAFADGRTFRLPYEFLRVYSPSAEVRGHGPGQEMLQVGKRDVTINEVEPVGHYAIRPTFSDGHDTGIYSWDYLYDLGERQDELWQRYLDRLAAAGASRDAERGAAAPRMPAARTERTPMSDKTHFGFEQVTPEEKTRRVRGVFDSVAEQVRPDERPDVGGPAPAVEALRGRRVRRARRACACSTSPAAPAISRACSPQRVGADGRASC